MLLPFLALGDSYTVGEGVRLQDTFPYQVLHLLRKAGHLFAAPEIIATTGWTTSELLAAMRDHSFLSSYELVTLCIGVNNQYRGLPLEDYRADVNLLLQKAVGLAGGDAGKVFVMSIPDYGVTPFAQTLNRPTISSEINSFNEVMRAACTSAGIVFTDISGASRAAADNPELLAGDGLHPSGDAYHQWANALFFPLQKRLDQAK